MIIPVELQDFFQLSHFHNYPKIIIPQSFCDDRGLIQNIADGIIGDVAIIHSIKGATRANHLHNTDWHLSYCLSGSLNYSYGHAEDKVQTVRINSGNLFFTPARVPHRMDFLEDTVLVVVSRNSRKSEKYEEDTRKLNLNIESIIK